MASIFDDPTKTPSGSLTKLTATVGQRGVTTFLTRTYSPDDPITDSFYDGLENKLASNEIPFGFGRTILTGQVTNKNVIRSDLDPEQLKAVIQFVTGEGPVQGVVGVDASKLKSVLVGGKTVTTTTTGGSSNVGFKEILGGLAGTAITMGAMSYVKDFLSNKDPVTGEVLPNNPKPLAGDNKSITTSNIKDFNIAGANDYDILVFDKALKKWVSKSFVEVHKKSGIGLTPFKIFKDGTLIREDTDSINFIGTPVAVADVGGTDKKVNVTITATGGGGGTDPGGGGDPIPPTTTCSKQLTVTVFPFTGSNFALKRNGVTMATYRGESLSGTRSQTAMATKLASSTNIPGANKGKKYTVSSSGPTISIVGDTTCKPCDIGTWTLEQYSSGNTPASGSTPGNANPCAIVQPSIKA